MRSRLCLDRGWLFHQGDIESPVPNTHIAAYMNHKAGWARGAARSNFDDTDWRPVDLPHDWSVEGNFSPDNHLSAAFLPRGVGWYRRWFRLDEADGGRRISLTFDGVATHCTVYVNGHLLHRNFNGYTPFTVDISDIATFGDALNVVAVRVDATYMEGWWYEGAGIYRHVWLTKTEPVHLVENSVAAWAERLDPDRWRLQVQAEVANLASAARRIDIEFQVLDRAGHRVRSEHALLELGPGQSGSVRDVTVVSEVEPWTLESPNLYTLRTLVKDSDTVVDQLDTTFGFRTIRFDPNEGFFLNDRPVKLLGTCNHQDHAGVGVALPDWLHGWRIAKLKEMGCNAYRCAHHPPAPELLDACDRLGMLVMDENRTFGSSPEVLDQLRTMVKRDRNHPSVILWSICNEESIQTTPVSGNIARAMADEVRRLDPSRPVTASVSGGVLLDGTIGDQLDVMSINYQLPAHDQYHEKKPTRPLVAGETHCVVSTRGVYVSDETTGVWACDDTAKHPWGEFARATWRFVRDRPHIAGLFAWTGFDYRGEPKPNRWPTVISQMGMLDLCGFEKDSFHLHKAWWTAEPFVHLAPHWNWSPGETVTVRAYTNCDEAELSLNGRSLGRKSVDPIEMARWDVPFEPGELRAEGFRQGRLVTGASVNTAGPPAGLHLTCMTLQPVNPANAPGLAPIKAEALDAQGRHVPTASDQVKFEVSGPAQILGVGNGDPNSHEPDRSDTRRLYNGLAQLIVEATGDAGGIVIVARAPGLQPAVLELPLPPASATPNPIRQVPPAQRRHLITDWRASPITPDRPDPNVQIAAADMNSWERVTIGPAGAPAMAEKGYRVYRATFTPPKSLQAAGGRLVLGRVGGDIEVYLDGVQTATSPAAEGIVAPFPAGGGRQTVSILVQSKRAGEVILAGPVELLPIGLF